VNYIVMGTLVHSFQHNEAGKTDLIVETILLVVVYITLGFRLWSRQLQRVQFQLNDHLIIVATVSLRVRNEAPTYLWEFQLTLFILGSHEWEICC
jgi:uncharacterized membrane protein SirB2